MAESSVPDSGVKIKLLSLTHTHTPTHTEHNWQSLIGSQLAKRFAKSPLQYHVKQLEGESKS